MSNPQRPISPQQLQVVWVSLLGAVVMYGAAAMLVAQQGGEPSPLVGVLRAFFAAAGAVAAAVSFWLRRSLAPAVPSVAPPAAPARVVTRCVAAWVIADAIAIFGLVLAALARNPLELVPFAAGAVLLLLAHRPAVWPLVPSQPVR